MKLVSFFSLITILAVACTPSIPTIEYGSDMCHYCKMSIVGKQHAAIAVSSKGKSFKFDAIECLVPFLAAETETTFNKLLVNDYDQPTTLISAEQSYYLISREIPSPMGAFLTAFSTQARAEFVKNEKGGTVYNWDEIQAHLTQ